MCAEVQSGRTPAVSVAGSGSATRVDANTSINAYVRLNKRSICKHGMGHFGARGKSSACPCTTQRRVPLHHNSTQAGPQQDGTLETHQRHEAGQGPQPLYAAGGQHVLAQGPAAGGSKLWGRTTGQLIHGGMQQEAGSLCRC